MGDTCARSSPRGAALGALDRSPRADAHRRAGRVASDRGGPHRGCLQAGRDSYEIKDVDGTLHARHVRIEYDDGTKRFYWERPDGRSGLGGRSVESLPLYRPDWLRRFVPSVTTTAAPRARRRAWRCGEPTSRPSAR